MDGIGVAQIPLKGLEHVSLRLEDLLLGVSVFGTVKKLSNRQCDSLLGLASDKEKRQVIPSIWSLARDTM